MQFIPCLLLGLATVPVARAAPASPSCLPTVDLGYEIHQAISFNETGQVYNFSNIRYAQPPVGDLRWAAPVPPTGRNPQVQTGNVEHICPQAVPAWTAIAQNFTLAYVQGLPFNFSAAEAALQADLESGHGPPVDPRTSEDCLFLDVFVPKAIFEKQLKAPVLVWIFGGGYVEGSKGAYGSPAGLIHSSQNNNAEGIVFVQLNYRLGGLGWLAGPSLQAAGGVSNAGLYDQRLALEWVQNYIHLFGGDSNRVTVMGESAGGGSIMHQITAYGGQKPVPFQQAIVQSGSWVPVTSMWIQENTTQDFLDLLGVSTIEEARKLPSSAVIAANSQQIGSAAYGEFGYGPVVDNIFAPALPSQLLADGAFAKDLNIMVGYNSDEGVSFTDPRVTTDAELIEYLHAGFPDIQDNIAEYIVKQLYPPVYDGSMPYTTPLQRTIFLVSESLFDCNTFYINRAFGNKTYAYEFSVPPGTHGEDVAYTWFNGTSGNPQTGGTDGTVATAFQTYLTNFAKTGNPNGPGVPEFPAYGTQATEENLNITGFTPMRDPTANARCAWWQLGLQN